MAANMKATLRSLANVRMIWPTPLMEATNSRDASSHGREHHRDLQACHDVAGPSVSSTRIHTEGRVKEEGCGLALPDFAPSHGVPRRELARRREHPGLHGPRRARFYVADASTGTP